jgi:hypothetical protein
MTAVPREILTTVVEGSDGCRDWTGVMQCAGCELLRIHLPRRWVNKCVEAEHVRP